MKLLSQELRLAATDLSNHLACRHVTTLDLGVARGEGTAPKWEAPDLAVIQELGRRHEAAYLNHLRDEGRWLVNLGEIKDEKRSIAETLSCMKRGVEVIAQGTLADGRWFGRPDVLRKVNGKSDFGDYSYEVYDCKLTRETKGATILQLALYSELLAKAQNKEPEHMYVIPGGAQFKAEVYRCNEYSAYYRYVKRQLEAASRNGSPNHTYPEPCEHCDVCRWFRECDGRRRSDDHLSLVAGITSIQRGQLTEWGTDTVAKLAVLPIPLERKPSRGMRDGYKRVKEQASLQVEARALGTPRFQLLDPLKGTGFYTLPEPSRLDMFVDLEGDTFAAEGGRDYLFGFVAGDTGQPLLYEKQWSLTQAEEKRAFEWLADEVIRRWAADPNMHVYHFGTYERDHFRLLMGRHATREDQIDKMLRAHLFVDLHTIFKQAVRAGVEEYSLKRLEVFHDFERLASLDESRVAMRMIEHWLELDKSGELRTQDKAAMEGYNEDDCRSTVSLRNWLEAKRRELVENGMEIPRPAHVDGEPKKKQHEHEQEVAKVVGQLTLDIPSEPAKPTEEQTARRTLALLLDWHRREIRVGYAEGYRFAEFDDDRLLDERVGLAGLKHEKRISNDRGCPLDRYTFEPQKTNIRREKDLYLDSEKFGEVVEIDHINGTVDIKKTKKSAEIHPSGLYMWDRPYGDDQQKGALLRIGRWVAENHVDAVGRYRAARDLLLRREPRRIGNIPMVAARPENTEARANRLAGALDNSVLAIQGPPGSGKTHLAARMICKLAKEGKKIGVCALSHKVIRHLLDAVVVQADDPRDVRCMQRSDYDEETLDIAIARDNEPALDALKSGEANVVGGTSYLWATEASFEVLDFLFIDEAGQMSLADVMAVAQATKNLILVGDPQQLERPIKANHPAETDESALEHLLGEAKTISDEQGMFLPRTHRLHPKICDFTSQVFYDGRLESEQVARNRSLAGHPWLDAAGLWFVPVDHEGNGNSSPEEVAVIANIAESLLAPGVERFRSIGNSESVKWKDILIVAPYNAQVSDLKARLPDARVGTVDKLQGQEASIVIYSLTSSSPGEVPRGMEFFFSLNRFNVATSRGETTVIVVGNPRLFEPECKTPRQMQLANAFCRYLEMATTYSIG
jgi:uncharacterized protein